MGGGKSFFGCRYSVQLAEDNPGVRGYLCRAEAVTFKRTTLITMLDTEEGVGILSRPGWTHRITDQCFIHANGSRLDYGGISSTEDRDKVKSMNLTFAFVDEASEVDQVSARLIEARCNRQVAFSPHAVTLYASNPEPCWLQSDFIDDPKPGRRYVQSLPSDNTKLPEGYLAHLRETYADMPELLDAYLNGSWGAIGAQDKVFSAALVQASMARTVAFGTTCEWGIDVARMGDDKTKVYERRGMVARKVTEWAKQDTRTTSDKIVALYRAAAVKPTRVKVDDIGVGGGVTDNLKAAGLPVVGVNVGERADEADKFANKRAELAWHLRVLMEDGAALPQDEALRSELTAFRYFVRSGRIVIESKEDLKKRLGRSPDDADALILAFAPVREFVFAM